MGVLSSLARGRAWNEQTGSVKEAQAVGREIFARNTPLTRCKNCAGEPGEKIIYIVGDQDESEEDMGCSCCLRWNAGVLEQLVCGEWVPVPGDYGEPPNEPPDNDPGDPDTPQPGDDDEVDIDIKCRASWMIAQAMWNVHERVIDYIDDVWTIPFIGEKVAADLPEYTLSTYHISQAAASLILAVGTADFDLAFGVESSQVPDMAAYMAKFMPTRYSLNLIQYNALAASLVFYSFNEGIELNLGQFIEGDYWQQIFRALGHGTVNDLMVRARQLDASEFDCHERVVTPPSQTTLVFLSNLVKTAGDGDMAVTLSEGRSKADFAWTGTSSSASTDWQGTQGVDCSAPITDIVVRVQGINGNPPTQEWETEPPYTIAPPDFGTAPDSISTLTSGSNYAVFGMHWATPITPTELAHSFKYPGRYAPNPFNLTWYFHILSAE